MELLKNKFDEQGEGERNETTDIRNDDHVNFSREEEDTDVGIGDHVSVVSSVQSDLIKTGVMHT
jgi:hypothetical protein